VRSKRVYDRDDETGLFQPRHKAERCRCGSAIVGRCEQIIHVAVMTHTWNVERGDIVFRDDPDRRDYFTVDRIAARPGVFDLYARQGKPFTVSSDSAIWVRRVARCQTACCERHMMDRAGLIICVDHWDTWERIQ
jgi:hypothetical protein